MSLNPIFEKLVGPNDADLEALTAYALYKKHKRAWARDIKEGTGRLPTPAQEREFYTAVGTPDQLDRYRKDAQDILLAYAQQMIEASRADIGRQAIGDRIEAAAGKIETSGSFVSSVRSGIVSTLINTAVLLLLAVALKLWGIELLSAYEGLGRQAPSEAVAG